MAKAARVLGDTLKEVAEKNNLELRDGCLVCVSCNTFGSVNRGHEPGVFTTQRPLGELRKVAARHFESPQHKLCVALNVQAKEDDKRRRASPSSPSWHVCLL